MSDPWTDVPSGVGPNQAGPALPEEITSKSPARMETRTIAVDLLVPHPLNANVLPEDLREKLAAHIRATGRYPHLIVRPHPKQEGRYEVLDGHHRLLVLRELGHVDARCDIWDVNDREARLLLATLNRLEGQDLPIRRAQLIHELLGEIVSRQPLWHRWAPNLRDTDSIQRRQDTFLDPRGQTSVEAPSPA